MKDHPHRRRIGRGAVLAAVALAALLVLPSAASAAPPTLLSVGQDAGHPTAEWSLPPGMASGFIEVTRDPATDFDGFFEDYEIFEVLEGEQTSWRGEEALPGGTHYVHVSAYDPEGGLDDEWSNVLPLVIPGASVAGSYAGKTGQGKRIRFRVTADESHIKGLKVRARVKCRIRGVGRRTISGGTRVRSIKLRGGRFKKKVRRGLRGGPGRERTTIKGRFTGSKFRGRLRTRLSGPRFRCNSGNVGWKAK